MDRTVRKGPADTSVVASLDQSQADLAAGRITDFDDFLDELRVEIESAFREKDARKLGRAV